jgi:1-acyl-sn-glycerol-3-phosphate acyltransferase
MVIVDSLQGGPSGVKFARAIQSPSPAQHTPRCGRQMNVGRTASLVRFCLGTAIALPFVLVSWAVVAMSSEAVAFRVSRFVARAMAWVAGWRLSVVGVERLPSRGEPMILVSNHASFVDIPAMIALLPLDFVFVAKKEVLRWPFVATFARKLRHPTVDRQNAQRSVGELRRIAEVVRRGTPVLFFPEGTFTATPGLRQFRLGAFKLAIEQGVPIGPLALRGTRAAMRKGESLPHPAAIDLWIGEPIVSGAEGDAAALRDRVVETIAAHCGEPRLDTVTPEPVGG